MGFYDVLQTCAATHSMSLRQVSIAMGRNGNYVSGAVTRGSVPSVDNAAAMLAACGWSLCAVPSEDVPPSALVIDPPEQEEDAERRALERRRARLAADLAAVDERLGS